MKTLFVVMDFIQANKAICAFRPNGPIPLMNECMIIIRTVCEDAFRAASTRSLAQMTGLEPSGLVRLFVSLINDPSYDPPLRKLAFFLFAKLSEPHTLKISEALGSLDAYFPPLLLLSTIETDIKTETTLIQTQGTMVETWHWSLVSRPSFECREVFAKQAISDGVIPFLGDYSFNSLVGRMGAKGQSSVGVYIVYCLS